MTNAYFDSTIALTDFTRARAAPINALSAQVEASFDLLPTPTVFGLTIKQVVAAGGSANAITLDNAVNVTAYALGQRVSFKATATNTTATTINIDGVGAVALKRPNGDALVAGDITSGRVYDAVYDGTYFQLTIVTADVLSSATAAAASAVAAAASAAAAAVSAAEAAASALSVNDANLVHIAGSETITGVKTFQAGLIINGQTLDGLTATGLAIAEAADAAAVRTAAGVVIGTHVQAYNANLTTYAGIAPSANVQTLLGSADFSAFKTSLSLNNVDNTSDASKPVSTATQTALDLKAALASPTFTGTPAAPTAAVGTSTTQLATTAFVQAAKGWANSGAAVSTASGTAWTFSSIPGTSNELKFDIVGMSHSGGGSPTLTMEVSDDNGSTWSTAANACANATNSATLVYGSIIISDYANSLGVGCIAAAVIASNTEPHLVSTNTLGATFMYHLAGGAINAVRFAWSGAETGDAGSIQMKVR